MAVINILMNLTSLIGGCSHDPAKIAISILDVLEKETNNNKLQRNSQIIDK